MDDALKLAGLIVSGVLCFGFATIGICFGFPALVPFAYAFGGVFGTILGIPIFSAVGRAIKKLAKLIAG